MFKATNFIVVTTHDSNDSDDYCINAASSYVHIRQPGRIGMVGELDVLAEETTKEVNNGKNAIDKQQ